MPNLSKKCCCANFKQKVSKKWAKSAKSVVSGGGGAAAGGGGVCLAISIGRTYLFFYELEMKKFSFRAQKKNEQRL